MRKNTRARPETSKGAVVRTTLTAARIRQVVARDLDQIVAIDAAATGTAKFDYWRALYSRFSTAGHSHRTFLVAEQTGTIQGFAIGEVRDWEFGSAPCGWVFAITVRPDVRLQGIGTQLLDSICASFRRAGIDKVRTLLDRDDKLVLSFFRSQGMMAAPLIALERDL